MNEKLLPIRIDPVFFTYLWGGTLLKDLYQKATPDKYTGESWEVSAHEKGQSRIIGGTYDGLELMDYVGQICDIQGLEVPKRFPLLIKLIGPKQQLSVQVHPNDDYGYEHEGEPGKAEAWVVLSAPEDAKLICGVNCNREQFKKAIDDDRIESCLNYIPVKTGDVICIPAGLVHALSTEVVVYEVQQNSDTTYRLYDWNRLEQRTKKPRELHIDKGLEVIDFDLVGGVSEGVTLEERGASRNVLAATDKYTLERIMVDGCWQDELAAIVDTADFPAYTVIKGSGKVISEQGALFDVSLGQTFMAPPKGEPWMFSGKATLVKGSCPKVSVVRDYLKHKGVGDISKVFGL